MNKLFASLMEKMLISFFTSIIIFWRSFSIVNIAARSPHHHTSKVLASNLVTFRYDSYLATLQTTVGIVSSFHLHQEYPLGQHKVVPLDFLEHTLIGIEIWKRFIDTNAYFLCVT